MNRNKLEKAIILFAEKYGRIDSFVYLIKNEPSPSTIPMVISMLFEHEFNPYFASEEEFEAHKTILCYYRELRKRGYVEFDK